MSEQEKIDSAVQIMMSGCTYVNTYGIPIKCLVAGGRIQIDGIWCSPGMFIIEPESVFMWIVEDYENGSAAFEITKSGSRATSDEYQNDFKVGIKVKPASLPVGVPDAEALLTRLAEWCDKQPKQPWYGRTAGDMVRTFMACQPLDEPAAQPASEQSTTDKQSLTVAEQSAPDHIEDSLGMVEQSAPGEVEEVEVRGLQWLDTGHYRKKPPQFGYNPHDWNPLMSVDQHKRIVAQLAARDAGVVRVPVELLQRCASRLHNMMQADLEAELRALLAQRERGGA